MINRNYNLKYVDVALANDISMILASHGILTENRVMLICPPTEAKTNTGIILPDTAKDELPKKGIIVQMSMFDDDNARLAHCLNIGQKVTFGIYAGKEIIFEDDIFPEDVKNRIPEGSKFTILSCTEIIYIETNK